MEQQHQPEEHGQYQAEPAEQADPRPAQRASVATRAAKTDSPLARTMSGDHATVTAERLATARTGARGQSAAARAVLETAIVAATDELGHRRSPRARAEAFFPRHPREAGPTPRGPSPGGSSPRGSSPRGLAENPAFAEATGFASRGLRAARFAESLVCMPFSSFGATGARLLILPLFAACGAGAVSYSGDTQLAQLEPAHLGSGDEAPAELHRLGHVSAGCKLADVSGGFEGVRSSDLACSPSFLRAALRERAAKAGGTFLVEFECYPEGEAMPAGSHRASCSADVWGPRAKAGVSPAAVSPAAAEGEPPWPAIELAPPFHEVDEAWSALVDYWPAPGAPTRSPVGDGQVVEVDFPRAGQTRFGDVRARADGPCSIDTLRAALRAAAARVGATSVVDVRCVSDDGAPFCVAGLAGPEVIEAAVAEVR